MTSHTVHIDTHQHGDRLDRCLAAACPTLSRSRIQTLIGEGHVALTEVGIRRTIEDPAHKVKQGQQYEISIPDVRPTHIKAQAMALDVVHEDKDLLVINKSAGLTVHPAPGHPDHTLVNALLAHCGSSLSGIGGVARPGIVHRIDKDTSGLLVVAKHDAAHAALSAQLAERTLKRTYLALVWGCPKTSKGTIQGNIGRSPRNRQKMAVLKIGGKEATTHFEVLQQLNPTSLAKPLASLLQCQLETGRTHQIRVHLSHLGHPLIGDATYGSNAASRLNAASLKRIPDPLRQTLLAFNRQALHAFRLGLIHPSNGKKMEFEAPMPEDIANLLDVLGHLG